VVRQPAVQRCPPGPERERLQQIAARLAGLGYEQVRDSMALFDTPRACVAHLERLQRELRPGRVICWFDFGGAVSHEEACASMALFSAEVIPRFRPAWPRVAA
jgi:hypothetical protein